MLSLVISDIRFSIHDPILHFDLDAGVRKSNIAQVQNMSAPIYDRMNGIDGIATLSRTRCLIDCFGLNPPSCIARSSDTLLPDLQQFLLKHSLVIFAQRND